MKYRCRCMNKHPDRRVCQTRKSFNKKPSDYKKLPACINCGSSEHWRIDHHRQSKLETKRKKKCNCNGHIWSCAGGFHQWGSVGCIHREEKLLEMAASGRGGEQLAEPIF